MYSSDIICLTETHISPDKDIARIFNMILKTLILFTWINWLGLKVLVFFIQIYT